MSTKVGEVQSRADEFTRPYRITIPRTDCGFVFIPLTKELFQHRETALQNMTLAHKYEHHLSKCIGVAIGNHQAGGRFHAEWCYMNVPWEQDNELESLLAENNPFRPTKATELPRYDLNFPRA